MVRFRLVHAALLVTVLGCMPGKPANMPASAQHPLLGKPLPAFKRQTLAGQSVDTTETRGSVVVVKVFAKYCEPCKRTLPAAQKLHEELPDVSFIGVDEDESRADAETVVGDFHLTFPVILDAGNTLSGRLRVQELPVTFVADAKGTIRWIGGPDQAEGALGEAVRFLRNGS
ncbi:MAG: TlpA family protein disulfide reductase [Polyangiales bacterium]